MIKIKANAKLNLYLKIIGERQDGYHNLDMIMQSIDLSDTLTFEKSGAIRISCNKSRIPTNQKNIAYTAAQAFFMATGIRAGVDIQIEKCIPEEAGLGGGSSNAAATLLGLNLLYGRPLSDESLLEIARDVGADVPFSLIGGCKRAKGIGEKLESIVNRLDCSFLILKPRDGVSTKTAYTEYDTRIEPEPLGIDKCVEALRKGNFQQFSKYTFNSLQQTAAALCPAIAELLQYLSESSEAAFMTGSGSACVGICRTPEDAQAALRCAPDLCDFSYIARPADCGLAVLDGI